MKKRFSGMRVPVLFLVFTVPVVLFSCSGRPNEVLQRLMATQASQYEGEEISKDKVEELERHVRLFEDEVSELVQKKGKLGIYYRMLGMEYLDQDMFGPAYEAFLKALEIYPNNHIIHYYAGVALSQTAQAKPAERKREELLKETAAYYERAIELKGTYVKALYALSLLYVFELDRPGEAEGYVKKILDIDTKHYRAMFLLARIRVVQGRVEEAVEMYTQIAEEAAQQEMIERAKENRERLMRGEYGG